MSVAGRRCVLVTWLIFIALSIYGASQLEKNFSMDYMMPKGSYTIAYTDLDKEYFDTGIMTLIILDNNVIDYSLEETQYQLLDFYDKLQRCYLCDQSWAKKNTLVSIYLSFLQWIDANQCTLMPEGLSAF